MQLLLQQPATTRRAKHQNVRYISVLLQAVPQVRNGEQLRWAHGRVVGVHNSALTARETRNRTQQQLPEE